GAVCPAQQPRAGVTGPQAGECIAGFAKPEAGVKFDRNPSLPLRLNRRAGVPPAAGRSQADSANANALCATLLLRPRRSRAGSWFRCADRKPRSLCQQGIVCITLVVFAFATVRLSASEVATAFDQANKLYEQGKYAEAAVAYDRLIQAGHTSRSEEHTSELQSRG